MFLERVLFDFRFKVNMIKYFSADYIYTINGKPLKRGVVSVDDNGTIVGVYDAQDKDIADKEIEQLSGVIIPGFVNAHCHLELSHMKGVISEHTGLPNFLTSVMRQRRAADEEVQKAMIEADKMMFDNGIQAVGDHANTSVSQQVKSQSKILYHTFVEMLGMDELVAQQKIDDAREVEFAFGSKQTSITVHAPYSCSKVLFKTFAKSVDDENIVSIHSQESDEENKLFRYKKGAFLDFYKENNIPYEHFSLTGKGSLKSIVPLLPKKNKLLLVHNTYTPIKDIDYLARIDRHVFFCFCPKANLYIEDQLPRFRNFFLNNLNTIVVGTDSLASNDTLDILEELKVISKNEPELSIEELLQWATLNGAKALGLEDRVGSLEVGKQPGLLLLTGLSGTGINAEAKVKRIV